MAEIATPTGPTSTTLGVANCTDELSADEYKHEIKTLRDELATVRAHNEALEDNNLDLRAQLATKKQIENDLNKQLKLLSEFAINSGQSHQKQVDLQRMYDQMCYKDNKIMELNNLVMDKERQIIDLQEFCREQNQVAEAKSKAVQIVNRRLKELDSRQFSDAATSTDSFALLKKGKSANREISPGRAVPQLRMNGHNASPPPVDPSEEQSSYTTENYQDEGGEADREWSTSPTPSGQRRRYRKKVTFDLRAPQSPLGSASTSTLVDKSDKCTDEDRESLAQAVVDLSAENDQLRRTIAEMEKSQAGQNEGEKITALEEEAEQARRDAVSQSIRARAAAVAKIRDLETKLFQLRVDSSKEIEGLKAANEVLKTSREWSLLENSKQLERINTLRQKLDDLRGELDASNAATSVIRQRLDAEERRYEGLAADMRAVNLANQQLCDEKNYLVNEVERLKDEVTQQSDLISQMEGDLIVYEAHVSIMRESLSISKSEEKQLIKSKAFAAKLSTLEKEKEIIAKRNNEERIRTKALNARIRNLESERDTLVESIMNAQGLLRQYEESKGSGRRTFSGASSINDEEKNSRENETTAIFNGTVSAEADDTRPRFEDLHENGPKQNESPHEEYSEVEQKAEEAVKTLLMPAFSGPTTVVPTPIKFQRNSAFQPLQPGRDNVDPTTQASVAELEQRVQALQSENDGERVHRDRLLADLQQLRDQQTEAVVCLNHFMHEICTQLRQSDQSYLADQMTADLENYAKQPDLDVLTVVAQSRRFVEEVVDSLIHDSSTLRTEKSALREQLDLARLSLNEVDLMNKAMDEIREQADPNTQQELNKVQEAKQRLEDRLNDMDKKALEVIIEREELEQKLRQVEAENFHLRAEHDRTAALLQDQQRRNGQLEHDTDHLRSEIDRLQVDLELQRNCIDDLRSRVQVEAPDAVQHGPHLEQDRVMAHNEVQQQPPPGPNARVERQRADFERQFQQVEYSQRENLAQPPQPGPHALGSTAEPHAQFAPVEYGQRLHDVQQVSNPEAVDVVYASELQAVQLEQRAFPPQPDQFADVAFAYHSQVNQFLHEEEVASQVEHLQHNHDVNLEEVDLDQSRPLQPVQVQQLDEQTANDTARQALSFVQQPQQFCQEVQLAESPQQVPDGQFYYETRLTEVVDRDIERFGSVNLPGDNEQPPQTFNWLQHNQHQEVKLTQPFDEVREEPPPLLQQEDTIYGSQVESPLVHDNERQGPNSNPEEHDDLEQRNDNLYDEKAATSHEVEEAVQLPDVHQIVHMEEGEGEPAQTMWNETEWDDELPPPEELAPQEDINLDDIDLGDSKNEPLEPGFGSEVEQQVEQESDAGHVESTVGVSEQDSSLAPDVVSTYEDCIETTNQPSSTWVSWKDEEEVKVVFRQENSIEIDETQIEEDETNVEEQKTDDKSEDTTTLGEPEDVEVKKEVPEDTWDEWDAEEPANSQHSLETEKTSQQAEEEMPLPTDTEVNDGSSEKAVAQTEVVEQSEPAKENVRTENPAEVAAHQEQRRSDFTDEESETSSGMERMERSEQEKVGDVQDGPHSLKILEDMATTSRQVAEYLEVQYQLMKDGKIPTTSLKVFESSQSLNSIGEESAKKPMPKLKLGLKLQKKRKESTESLPIPTSKPTNTKQKATSEGPSEEIKPVKVQVMEEETVQPDLSRNPPIDEPLDAENWAWGMEEKTEEKKKKVSGSKRELTPKSLTTQAPTTCPTATSVDEGLTEDHWAWGNEEKVAGVEEFVKLKPMPTTSKNAPPAETVKELARQPNEDSWGWGEDEEDQEEEQQEVVSATAQPDEWGWGDETEQGAPVSNAQQGATEWAWNEEDGDAQQSDKPDPDEAGWDNW